jgi:methionyl-tRNA synthetase
MRLDGYDVLFVTGTDEHGIKMLQTAAKQKLTPPQLVERNVPRFKAMVERLDCSNDVFIRTTEERHHRASIAIWQRMEAAGDIYLGKYSGWYWVRDEAYYDEDETRLNDEGERVGPQGTVEWVEEESYFFKPQPTSKSCSILRSSSRLRAAERAAQRGRGFCQRRPAGSVDLAHHLRLGRQGAAIQSMSWCGRRAHQLHHRRWLSGRDSPKFRRYWPTDLHVIGKDIVRFHAVYWPAFLMSAGVDVLRRHLLARFLFIAARRCRSPSVTWSIRSRWWAYGVDRSLFFPARSSVRAGRQLQPRGDRQAHQCRPRQ